MGLKPKFFAVILIVNGLLAGGLYLFLSWNFERSFSNYLNQRELRVLESFAEQLESFYTEQGSWDYFEKNPDQWDRFTFQTLAKDIRRRHRRPSDDNSNSIRDPFDNSKSQEGRKMEAPLFKRNRRFRNSSGIPIVLLDQNKRIVAGSFRNLKESKEENIERSLRVNGEPIGFLSIPARPSVRDYLDNQFIKDQSNNLIFILACVLIFAILSSISLSLFLIKRITKLVNHVKSLTLGDYDAKVTISGSDELSTLSHHLSDLGSTLKENTKQRKQWVADISHELRTPVAILQADLEAIEDGVRELNRSSVTRLQSHVGRLKDLIGDLYELSLSDSGSLTYNKRHISLCNILDDAVHAMEEKFNKKHIEFYYQKNIGTDPVTVLGDSNRLYQLLLNLLENSFKYTDSSEKLPGKIQIHLELKKQDDNNMAIITIKDSSPGVKRELLPRLTERLFRVDASRSRDTGGAGLGLTLCKNIVDAHHGKLDFSKSDFGGLEVNVSIPTIIETATNQD
ncbi:MAG: GHKL domain-containing protein [Cellvibrionaceae bacterium]